MPIALRRILFPRFVRRPINRAVNHVARSPFGRLVSQFLARTVRGSVPVNQGSADSEFDLGIGGLLGLLATPGSFTCFLLLDKYSALLNWMRSRRQDIYLVSLPDKYLFIALAMAVTGIVTVLKWDKILPDSQDYLNLAPLPVHRRIILLANAAAIAIAVLVFAVDVNAVPTFLFPLFVCASGQTSVAEFLRFAGVHFTCVLLATFFSICAVFAVLGTLAAVLPRETFRAVGSWIRGIVLLALIALLLTGFAGPALLRHLELAPGSAVRFLPSLWFLGLYQILQHRATPVLAGLAYSALEGTAAAFLLMAVSYAGSYRRRFAGVLEGGPRPSEQRLIALLLAFPRGGISARLPPVRRPRPVAQRTPSPGHFGFHWTRLAHGVPGLCPGRASLRRIPAHPWHSSGVRTPRRRARQLDLPRGSGPALERNPASRAPRHTQLPDPAGPAARFGARVVARRLGHRHHADGVRAGALALPHRNPIGGLPQDPAHLPHARLPRQLPDAVFHAIPGL